jgi:hypothetical protein
MEHDSEPNIYSVHVWIRGIHPMHHDRRRRHRMPHCFVPRRRLGAAPDGVRPGLNALLTPHQQQTTTMPVSDYKTYCQIVARARAGRFALPAVNVTSLTAASERVKQAVNDLRGPGVKVVR